MKRIKFTDYTINLRTLWTKPLYELPDWVNWEDCIYQVRNLITNQLYVGLSRNFHSRFSEDGPLSHLTAFTDQCINGGNKYLYNSIKKYHSINFEVSIIDEASDELVEELYGITNNQVDYYYDALKDLEKYWIKTLESHWTKGGFNMTLGGDTGDQLHTDKANEARKAAILARNRSIYGESATSVSQLFTKESLEKRYKTNLENGNGDPYYMIHTDEVIKGSQLRMRRTNEFNNINKIISSLRSEGLDITPENYYKYVYNNSTVNNIDRHIEVITTELYDPNPINLDDRWTSEMELIFRYFDSKSFEELHSEYNIVTKSGGLCKLRECVINTLIQLECTNNLTKESFIEYAGIDRFNRVKSYIDNPMIFKNDYRWKSEYNLIFY